MTLEETQILHELEGILYKKSQTSKHVTGQAAYIDASIQVLEAIKKIRLLKETIKTK